MHLRTVSDNIDQNIDHLISEFESVSRILDPDESQRDKLLKHAHKFVSSILDERPARGTFQPISRDSITAHLSISETGENVEDSIRVLNQHVFGPGVSCSSGGDLSYVPGGGIYPSALGDFIADVANNYPSQYCSPGALDLEQSLIRWMADLVGLPKTAGGDLTSGGSLATLCAIVTARESFKIRARDVHRMVVYMTEQTHSCVRKALHIAGLTECVVRCVALDDKLRMDPDALERSIFEDIDASLCPWIVVATAGTTCTGAVDPLHLIGQIAKKNNLWFHVDAAYGGFFLLTEHGRTVMCGIEQADTVVIDPHKSLFVPLGLGVILARDVSLLARAHRFTANYMQDDINAVGDKSWSPCDLGPELSRPFRGLRMWLPLRVFGVAPFRAALNEKLELARYLHQRLQQLPYFEVASIPQLSIVHYRFVPNSDNASVDHANQFLVDAIRRDGTVFISSTRLDGRVMLRSAVLHFRTHRYEIDCLVDILARLSASLLNSHLMPKSTSTV